MAVYEPDRGRIVLRVVYDGPGRAGKTTNVEQLAGIFGDRPGNELLVHPAATGRTIFFDWFSFDGGMIDGHPLQVQVVTVPGHKSLEPRRAHILHTAERLTGQFGLNAITGRAGSAQELRASLERIETSRVGRCAPERRKDDEVRAEVQAGLADAGRVVYIGSHELTHQRVAGDRAEPGTRGRTALQQSFSDMSEKDT
ncbi:hypothetical protein [Nannocystis bainbridge]|uniref:Uncharacterized protein n=1 Tax=Nannocystis bainbridge TaxID=2995303 RepID=A0ABT5DT92_9BACT|nr:hypothetical protein [Nannocystis bainbridge]MDC0716864.1 hypothetical protein [Nannocystis bainbridge]